MLGCPYRAGGAEKAISVPFPQEVVPRCSPFQITRFVYEGTFGDQIDGRPVFRRQGTPGLGRLNTALFQQVGNNDRIPRAGAQFFSADCTAALVAAIHCDRGKGLGKVALPLVAGDKQGQADRHGGAGTQRIQNFPTGKAGEGSLTDFLPVAGNDADLGCLEFHIS